MHNLCNIEIIFHCKIVCDKTTVNYIQGETIRNVALRRFVYDTNKLSCDCLRKAYDLRQ